MRTSLVLSLILAAAATASAEPARTVCYAGNQTAKLGTIEQTTHAVLERTYDPDKSEMRQRGWSDKNPTVEAITGKVDLKTNTFVFDDPELGAKVTGTLEGKPWHWTAFTTTLTNGDLAITTNSTVSDARIHQDGAIKNKGQVVGTVTADLTAFDCKQLDARTAALSKTSAGATSTPKTSAGATSTPKAPSPAK